jgi:predicted anti-sigma-YlaC factor YlaD
MTCEEWREALSAEMDGESGPETRAAIDVHVAECCACDAWKEAAHAVTRRARVGVAQEVPDLTVRMLAAWGSLTEPAHRLTRFRRRKIAWSRTRSAVLQRARKRVRD